MLPNCARLVALAALLLAHASVWGQEQSAPKGFFETHDRGWHFYDDPPPPSKRKPIIKPPLSPSSPAAPPAPAPLSTEWLRENLPRFRDRAIDNPTRENVEVFAYLQRLSLDKAEKFAQVMEVVSTQPGLDESARSPLSSYQLGAARKVRSQALGQVFAALAARGVGIWYFFRSDCPYCAKQDPVLEGFAAETGLQILPVSIDGKPLISGAFPDYVVNAGQGERLQVAVTPTLVLANSRTGETIKFAEGLKTQSEIEDRVLSVAHSSGWITDSEYDQATRGMPRRYLADNLTAEQIAELEASPEELLSVLRAAATPTAGTPVDLATPGAAQ